MENNAKNILKNVLSTYDENAFENLKVKAYIDYLFQGDIIIPDVGQKISLQSFITLVENTNSFNTVTKILSNRILRLNLDEKAKEIANWYNIYDINRLNWHIDEKSKIILDEEYLKYASVEWTQSILYNMNKNLYYNKQDDKFYLRSTGMDKWEDGYVRPFSQNLAVLSKAKENGRLKEAMQALIEYSIDRENV